MLGDESGVFCEVGGQGAHNSPNAKVGVSWCLAMRRDMQIRVRVKSTKLGVLTDGIKRLMARNSTARITKLFVLANLGMPRHELMAVLA